MKKRILAGMALGLMIVAGLSGQARASLVVAGTVDSGPYAGVKVINDTDLNITWLDYTNSDDTWSSQMTWASDLSVTVNGVTYDNWRLPATVDGPYSYGYDGTTTAGYNITSSEMGHLYYTELGNQGAYDTNGDDQPDFGLTETGFFDNLVSSGYWSSTEYSDIPFYAWNFYMDFGAQEPVDGDIFLYHGLAVLPGQIQAVPEPASVLLICAGVAGLAGAGRRRRGH